MLTQDRLKSLLHYDPETGKWRWLRRSSNLVRRIKAGDAAGTVGRSYLSIGIEGKRYLGHVLAFLYMTGEFPEKEVDHIDLDRGNNRWSNLREATHRQNTWNQGKRSTNTTGFKGTWFCKRTKRYGAKIWVSGRQIYLGHRDTAAEAHALYAEAAKFHHGEFARAA